jgi:hypothetical protein
MKWIIGFVCFFFPICLFAQIYDYGFVRDFSIPVYDSSLVRLDKAWDGGLNACHFNEIDLNFDGVKDLVVFDKIGDRLLTYINNGTADSADYTFEPEYAYSFPQVTGWIQLKDYNCDGKEDIFAFNIAGIQVWKNVSVSTLKFELVTPLLVSFQFVGYSNIMLTSVDYPAIDDIDGDGDLDILVFYGMGAYVQMHKNESMELYGNCDTLLYKCEFNCWGDFAESSSTNHIILGLTCPWKCHQMVEENNQDKGNSKHTGSTMLMFDANNDGLKDLVLGDVDFMNLTLLINGGTADSAHMISVDSLFPSNSLPVNLVSFSSASMVDINNDSIRDLLVSPFDPNPYLPESFQSVWYYKNTGSNVLPVFQYRSNNFLQGEMIDVGTGANPVLFDQDGDGLKDLVVANYGYLDSSYYALGYLKAVFKSRLALFRNTGTSAAPQFTLVTRDFGNLSSLKQRALYPTFGDLDNDGDEDMICGDSVGKLIYFDNIAGAGNPAVFGPAQMNYQGIDVGEFSAPVLVDMDGDALLDLVIGKKTGMLSWFKNEGSPTIPVFVHMTDTLGKVNVTNYAVSYTGCSTPCFYRDSLGLLKLFVGSEQGKIYYYKDIEANLNGKFTAVDSLLIYTYNDSLTRFINVGWRSSVAVGNLDGDKYPDLIAGNYSGGLNWFKGSAPKPYNSIDEWVSEEKMTFRVFPNPASDHLNISASNINESANLLLEIFDYSGRMLLSRPFAASPTTNINISELPQGFCFYRIICKSCKSGNVILQTGKLVIIR